MREIIFRGKNIESGEWLYGDYAVPTSLYHANIFTKENDLEGVAVDEETVGQYTGLTDIHGVKIFEGDIVKHYNNSPDCGYDVGVIKWSIEKVSFVRSSLQCNKNFYIADNYTYEIIGNIHDNDESMQSAEPPTQADSWLMSRFQKQE